MSRRTAALGAAALASLLAAVLLCACESPLSGDESAAGSQEDFLKVEDLVDQLREAIEGIQKLEDDIARVEAESAAKAEADRIRREAEAAARREAVAEAQMREIEDEPQTSKEDTEDSEIPEEQPENETL